MSGHSKWHQIKRKKEVSDARKSQIFTRLTRDIAAAARPNRDSTRNPALREAINRAKKAGVPRATIDRLLTTPTASAAATIYDAIGPGNSALLIIVSTDNPNRTVAELRTILKQYRATLGAPGSTRWKFSPAVIVRAALPAMNTAERETLELRLIEAGALDSRWIEGSMVVTAPATAVRAIETVLEKSGSTITERQPVQIAAQKQPLTLSQHEHVAALVAALSIHPNVTSVYTDSTDLI